MSLFEAALAWLTDPAHWTGAGSIPVRTAQHLAVTAAAVLLAALVGLPLGVLVGHTRRGRLVVVALAGAARAVPTLGLLTLLGLALGIGPRAPLVALVVLAVPSLIAGAYAGVAGVDPSTLDAARASGMTEGQVVRHVELPLAGPVIVGALRAATLQVVATATLAAYVADLGLGRYLFTGLKTRDYAQMLAGALLVTALALLLEVALSALHRASARHADPTRPRRTLRRAPLPEGHP
ncbi:ABC transporter permease [Cellulomonas soli]|uniref:ABC transporter permease n=1 Tax=Cellulomonas soli TaxID=931535 RepID=A0A512PBW1_9CELL|nr:ABC transporter permease subunit [Cellulomonas soli]NYI58274.1 osmoprotectant transport system permease protein [Cellulomonas soli]GEP68694.1 ABC transporter permease [Cellulomonas soli]